MALDFTAFQNAIQTKLNSTTDPKEMLLLGKAIEATVGATALSDVQAEGATQVAAVQAEATTQIGLVEAAGTTQVGAVQDEGTTQIGLIQSEAASYPKTNTANTWTAKQTFGTVAESWSALTGTTPSITAGNHTWATSGASTPTDGLADGEAATLIVTGADTNTVTWTSVVNKWLGDAPADFGADLTGEDAFYLFKQGTTVYATYLGGYTA